MNDTERAPRLLDVGMALWGAYVANDGDFTVAQEYMDNYAQNLRVPLTRNEERTWTSFMVARAYASWVGAINVNEKAAAGDARLIQKLTSTIEQEYGRPQYS